MSLKTDYLNGASGFTEQMIDVFAQGEAWVVANTAAISTQLQSNAAQGKRTFTINLPVAFEPANLRLNGYHWESFKAGVISGLAAESIFSYEVDVALNTGDLQTTSIDLNFTF